MRAIAEMNKDVQQLLQVVKVSEIKYLYLMIQMVDHDQLRSYRLSIQAYLNLRETVCLLLVSARIMLLMRHIFLTNIVTAAHDSDHVDDTENEWPSTPGHRKGSVPAICKCMNDDVGKIKQYLSNIAAAYDYAGDIESQCTLREAQIRDRGQPMKCHHRVRHTVRRIIRNILSLQPQTKILMP